MKINDDHMYHGAALTQIAEHPRFTAINAFKKATKISRSAFKVNDDIGLYLKYASRPKKPYNEYVFTFHSDHLEELAAVRRRCASVFLALVCVKARQICSLPYPHLQALIAARTTARGAPESQYALLVTAPAGKSFRVYMNAPGKRKTMLQAPLIVARSTFPDALFQ